MPLSAPTVYCHRPAEPSFPDPTANVILGMKHRRSQRVKINLQKNCSITRRVVITGIGAMAPNAIGTSAYGAALRAGTSGVAPNSLFDAGPLDCRIAAEVKDFRGEDYMSAQELRRVGRAVPLLIAAANEAFAQAGICWRHHSVADKQSWGVAIGSGGGTADFAEEQYRWFFSERLRRVSAYKVSSSTPGALASEVSLYFDLRGQSHLISTGCTRSTDALGYAFNLIRVGVAERLFSGGADATITPAIMQGFCVMRVVSASHNHDRLASLRPRARWFRLGRRRLGAGAGGARSGAGARRGHEEPVTVAVAAKQVAGWPEIAVLRGDAAAPPFAPKRFDWVLASQFLHHFSEAEIVALLQTWATLARRAIVVSDLVRHPLAYYGIQALTRMSTKNIMTRTDAPLSVRRAFTLAEWHDLFHQAGIGIIHVTPLLPFRMSAWIEIAG